jgi:hypothetical protein
MPTPPDYFSATFDAIEIDRSRAPTPEAIERALSFCAPQEAMDEPGFYLLDSAQGRFIVDRDTGVIALKDESVLERERNAVHIAKLRVVERSGAVYDLDLRLRMTGMVPHLAGAEDVFKSE